MNKVEWIGDYFNKIRCDNRGRYFSDDGETLRRRSEDSILQTNTENGNLLTWTWACAAKWLPTLRRFHTFRSGWKPSSMISLSLCFMMLQFETSMRRCYNVVDWCKTPIASLFRPDVLCKWLISIHYRFDSMKMINLSLWKYCEQTQGSDVVGQLHWTSLFDFIWKLLGDMSLSFFHRKYKKLDQRMSFSFLVFIRFFCKFDSFAIDENLTVYHLDLTLKKMKK